MTATEETEAVTTEPPEDPSRLRDKLRQKLSFVPARLYFYGTSMFYAVAGRDNELSLKTPVFPPPDADASPEQIATAEQINNRATEIIQERAGLRLWRTVILVLSASLPILAIGIVPIRADGRITGQHLTLGIIMGFAVAFCLVILMFVRRRVALLGAQLQLLEYDIVIASLVADHEKTAANLFFKHQTELKQYYDQTLRQNRQSFFLGVVLVIVGLGAIVSVVALVLASPDAPPSSRITVGALGGVAAVLTGFVARVYLRVYEGSASSLGNFHGRLVSTNNFHFANLLVSGIKSDARRIEALTELAATVARRSDELAGKD